MVRADAHIVMGQIQFGAYRDFVVVPALANMLTAKVQDAFGTPGAIPTYGVEIRNLDVIGFDLANPVPEPGTLLLMAVGLGLVCVKAHRRRA